MNGRLSWLTLIAGVLTGFTGTWGVIESFSLPSAEMQDLQFWVALGLLFAGIGLISAAADRLRTR